MSLLAALAMAASLSSVDCVAFAAHIDEPVTISAQTIPPEALGATPRPDRLGWTVGPFSYSGDGVVVKSDDPRFVQLVADPQRGLIHTCGHYFKGPISWDIRGETLSGSKLIFEPAPTKEPPLDISLEAQKMGAVPVLAGYNAGNTWPIGSDTNPAFLGLMHPDDGRKETLIVVFAARPGPSAAHAVARLPMRIDTITAVLELDRAYTLYALDALDAETGYRHFHLGLSKAEAAAIAKALE